MKRVLFRTSSLAAGASLIALACAGGCAGTKRAAFAPTEAEQPIGPNYPAAHYEIRVEGRTVGDIRVWSPGGYKVQTDGKTPTLHVGVRLQNQSNQTLALDLSQTNIEIITKKQRFIPIDRPLRVTGQARVAPGSSSRLDLFYPMPPGMNVGKVGAFDLNWVVVTAGGRRYAHSTPFVRRPEPENYYVYQPLYAYGWPGYPFYDWWYY